MNKRILIFASGRGSNAEALHEAAVDGTIKGRIVGVICDHHDAPVLQRAERWKVPATVIEMKTCRDKAVYEVGTISEGNRDVIVTGGLFHE